MVMLAFLSSRPETSLKSWLGGGLAVTVDVYYLTRLTHDELRLLEITGLSCGGFTIVSRRH